jgi:hypothetical protein
MSAGYLVAGKSLLSFEGGENPDADAAGFLGSRLPFLSFTVCSSKPLLQLVRLVPVAPAPSIGGDLSLANRN